MNSFNSRILKEIEVKQSHLCVGLDINPENFDNPDTSIQDLKNHTYKVIDATRDIAVAYKPNLAFFERWGRISPPIKLNLVLLTKYCLT